MRIGYGFDIHRLELGGKPLKIGGVAIAFDKGVIAHSDGDILLHAVCDALLGAAGLGDIGQHFPDNDPRHESADSLHLLNQVLQLIKQQGFYVINLDSTVIAENPKLAPYVNQMREVLATGLEVSIASVNVKAKTMEKLGEIGSGQAIAAHAVILLDKP